MPNGVPEPNYIKKRREAEGEQRKRQQHEDNMQVVGSLNRIRDELVTTEKQEQTDDDKRASREKLTIILLVLTVLFTAVADIIFFRTMQDARIAAANAHQDTLAAIDEARNSVTQQHSDTLTALEQTRQQVTATQEQAAAAIAQAQQSIAQTGIAQQGIIATTRPWIEISIIPTRVAVGEQLADVEFDAQFLNVGRSPANHLLIEPTITTDMNKIMKMDWMTTACKPIAERLHVDALQDTPTVVFPQHTFIKTERFIWNTNELSKMPFGVGASICAYYTFDGSDVPHATSIIFQLSRKFVCDGPHNTKCGNMFYSDVWRAYQSNDLTIIPETIRIAAD